MQTTIYIRKDNEEFWQSLDSKSLQVNTWIDEAKPKKPIIAPTQKPTEHVQPPKLNKSTSYKKTTNWGA